MLGIGWYCTFGKNTHILMVTINCRSALGEMQQLEKVITKYI